MIAGWGISYHYTDVIMGTVASHITSLTIAYFNRLFRRTSKKTSKLCITGLCVGNSPGTGEFPAQMASSAENVSIWWRHHVAIWLIWLGHTTNNSSLVQVVALCCQATSCYLSESWVRFMSPYDVISQKIFFIFVVTKQPLTYREISWELIRHFKGHDLVK